MKEPSVETKMRDYWFHAGQWHNAECDFLRYDYGVCNCKNSVIKKKIKSILATQQAQIELNHKREVAKATADLHCEIADLKFQQAQMREETEGLKRLYPENDGTVDQSDIDRIEIYNQAITDVLAITQGEK